MSQLGKYRVCMWFDEVCECQRATVDILREPEGYRQVIKMIPGPFDDPNDLLTTIIELIDQAEWYGEQLSLSIPPLEEQIDADGYRGTPPDLDEQSLPPAGVHDHERFTA